MIDIKAIKAEARAEIAKELGEKAKSAIKAKLRLLELAKDAVRNIEREVEDLEASIADGSFPVR